MDPVVYVAVVLVILIAFFAVLGTLFARKGILRRRPGVWYLDESQPGGWQKNPDPTTPPHLHHHHHGGHTPGADGGATHHHHGGIDPGMGHHHGGFDAGAGHHGGFDAGGGHGGGGHH